jgi:hypothetical protein
MAAMPPLPMSPPPPLESWFWLDPVLVAAI